ncbi:MAG: hypothetical protein H0V30_09965 [Chitinophagaceae bacterium]|jgi:hypothetical protein|nr:hypothetical protein [Chitinophagaceae bacterium]
MKKLINLVFLLMLGFLIQAQDCQNYYYLSNNAIVEMTVYDRKGKESGKQKWKVTEVKNQNNGYVSTIESVFTDEKGNETAQATGTYICNNGILKADMRMAVPQQQMDAYKNMEVRADEVYIEYPQNMAAGQTLQDGIFKMEMYNNNTLSTTINYSQVNRKVEGKENITSPAGSWEAYKISFEGQLKTMIGGIGIPMNFKSVEWFVPGFGMVKSETYSKNGKLMGSTLLTGYNK